MGEVLPKRNTPITPQDMSDPKGAENQALGNVLPHPIREERLKSGIMHLSANFPNAKQRASDAILRLIKMLSGDDHNLDQRRADELKVKLTRALAVLEAIHNRPASVSKDELESLKQAMILLHEVELRETQMGPAGKSRKSGLLN